MFYPQGTNLLTYPGYTAIGVLLLPVTAIFGPVAAFNVAIILGPVLSALAATWLATRWITSRVLCAGAGAIYAFSPIVILNEPLGHLNQTFLVGPPLVALGLYELFWRREHRPLRVGAALSAVLILQFFISTEVLAIIVVSATAQLALVAVVAAIVRRDALRSALHDRARGLVATSVVAGTVLLVPALFAVRGPSHFDGNVWPGRALSVTSIKDFFVPTTGFNLWWQHPTFNYFQPTYMAPTLLLVLLVGVAAARRIDLWVFVSLASVAAWLALGSSYVFSPWHWLGRLPLLENVVNTRFAIVMFLFSALALAGVADTARRWRPAPWGPAFAGAVFVLASFPYVGNAVGAAPYSAARVWIPRWYALHAPHLREKDVVLGFPFFNTTANFLSVQALENMSYTVVGGTSPQWLPERQGRARAGYQAIWNAASTAAQTHLSLTASPSDIADVRSALRFWRVDWIVIPQRNGPTTSHVARNPLVLALWMSSIVGPVTVHDGSWVWHLDDGRVPSEVS